ncbi:MAG: arylsulfatase [Akkermansiaceae bacterium]
MKSLSLIGLSLALVNLSIAQSANKKTEGKQPNIVLIMLDDMGYSDLGCYGGEIDTPNIDQLAKNGIRFSQFYNAGRCCPTRASMLTGLYPHRAGVGHMASRDYGFKGYKGELRPEAATIAENLKAAGYDTWMAGKWHLSINWSPDGSKHNWPLQRGFDKFYGTLIAAGSQWNPITLTEGNKSIFPVPANQDYYYTETLTSKATQWMSEKKGDKPFFLYMAYAAPHWPLHARQEVIDKYKKRYLKGYDKLRERRLTKLKVEGLISDVSTLSSRHPDVPAWENEKHKEWQASRMAAYAAMIDQVDTGVGQLVEQLKKNDQLKNTLILVLSDNGGSALEHPNGLIGSTGAPWTTMKYVPVFTRNKRAVISGDVVGLEPGPEDTYGGYGAGWANLSNAPFRMFKKFSHEGGVATPLVVSWPDKVKDKGSVLHQPGHVIDFLPTFLDAAGAKPLTTINNQKAMSLDGTSLVPILTGGKSRPSRPIGFEHAGNRGIRQGKWKLVAQSGRNWELYDLSSDRIEMNNLAKQRPEKFKEMLTLYNRWAEKNWVVEWPKVSAVLSGKQAGTVVLPDKDNPLRRTQEEVDQSVILINKERGIRKLPIMNDLSK